MSTFKVSVDLSEVLNVAPIINRALMPALNQAVRYIAQATANNWAEDVHRAKLWSGEKDAYANSITWQMTGDFSAVVQTEFKNAEGIEVGRPAYDLKQMLNTSPKVRRTKDGRRFMIIPMRANSPGNSALADAMPDSVYQAAYGLKPSSIVGQGQRPAGEMTSIHSTHGMRVLKKQTPFASDTKTRGPMLVNKNVYKWGGKLDTSSIAGLGAADKKKYAGMVRMSTTTPGGKRSSTYLTFRVMGEWSTGWILPAQPGKYIAKKVADEMQPKAERLIADAVSDSFL